MDDRSTYLFCDNFHRTNGNASEFTFNFLDSNITCEDDEVITVELFDFLCQNSISQISELNNKFVWNSTLIEITTGDYTPTQLATQLTTDINTQLAARSKYTWGLASEYDFFGGAPDHPKNQAPITVTFNSHTNKLKISADVSQLLYVNMLFTVELFFFKDDQFFQNPNLNVDLYNINPPPTRYFIPQSFGNYNRIAYSNEVSQQHPVAGGAQWSLEDLTGDSALLLGFVKEPKTIDERKPNVAGFVRDLNYHIDKIYPFDMSFRQIQFDMHAPGTVNISHKFNAIDIHILNIPTHNSETRLESKGHVKYSSRFARIPVLVPRGAFIYYQSMGNNQKMTLPDQSVNHLKFLMTNNYGEQIAVSGHVQFTLLFKILKKPTKDNSNVELLSRIEAHLKEIETINKMDFISQKNPKQ